MPSFSLLAVLSIFRSILSSTQIDWNWFTNRRDYWFILPEVSKRLYKNISILISLISFKCLKLTQSCCVMTTISKWIYQFLTGLSCAPIVGIPKETQKSGKLKSVFWDLADECFIQIGDNYAKATGICRCLSSARPFPFGRGNVLFHLSWSTCCLLKNY